MSQPPRYSIKPPTENMNLGIESPPLARTLPLHGVYIDRCIRPWFYESNHVLTGFNSRPITSSLSALYFSVEYYIYKLAIGTLAVVTMLINIHASKLKPKSMSDGKILLFVPTVSFSWRILSGEESVIHSIKD